MESLFNHVCVDNEPIWETLFEVAWLSEKRCQNLQNLIYHGEANIDQDDLQEFMELAQELQVKGLDNT